MTQLNALKWLPVLALAAAGTPCLAQRPADLKKSGDFYYNTGNYYSAASYYQQYIDGVRSGAKGTEGGFRPYGVSLGKPKGGGKGAATDAELLHRLAESYRRIHDDSHAAAAYEQLLKSDAASAYPDARYGYAVALRGQGKWAEAKAQLEQYLQTPGAKYAAAAQLELQHIAFAEKAMADPNAKSFTVARMAEPVNSAETNYSGTWSGGQLLFTSTRPDSALQAAGKNAFVNTLYTRDAAGTVQKVPVAPAEGSEQGAAALSPDGNTLYLTRWSYDRGTPVSAIFVARKQGSGWSEPVRLGAAVNAEGYSARQPFVSPDGRYLLFASDRPGGQGKYDLWAAPLTGGEPGAAINLGPAINTAEDEEAPFYHAPTGSLVFASRGRVGLGGLDLYSAKGAIGGNWTAPENLGHPVNSNRDDSYFSTASPDRLLKGAVISSDRGSDACLSLYSVDKQYRQFVAGSVVDCGTRQPLEGVRVSIDGRTATTVSGGTYLIEVDGFRSTGLAAGKEGYVDATQALAAPASGDVDTLQAAVLCLEAKPVDVVAPPKGDNTVLFDFAKYDLRPETQATLDKLAGILTREGSLRLVISGYTDQVGSDSYNLKLSRDRAEACRRYLLGKGVPASRIEVVAKGACCPLKPEKTADGQDDPAARQANRRVEFDLKLAQ